MLDTFDGPCYKKNEKYMKKHDCNNVFSCISQFSCSGAIESMQHGYILDEELNFTSKECSFSKFE